MADFSSSASIARYLAALEEQRKREEEAARFNVSFGPRPPVVQGPQPRPTAPVQGPQPRPVTPPAPQPQWSFTPPPQPMGPAPRPVQGPQPRPEVNPWQAALDQWQSGPPVSQSVSAPVLYDIEATRPQVGYSFDRPDTGPTGMQMPSFSPSTVNADAVTPYDPYAPEMPDAWGISRYGGGGQMGTNLTVPLGAAKVAAPWLQKAVGATAQGLGNMVMDAYGNLVYGPGEGDSQKPEAGDSADAWNPLSGDSVWARSGPELLDRFNNTAAAERMYYDVDASVKANQASADQTWGEFLKTSWNDISGAAGGLRDSLGRVTTGDGSIGDVGGNLLNLGLTAADVAMNTNPLTRATQVGLTGITSGLQAGQDLMNSIRADEIPGAQLLEQGFSAIAGQPADIGNDPLGTYWSAMLFEAGPAGVKEAVASAIAGEQNPLTRAAIRFMATAHETIMKQREAVTPTPEQAKSMTPEQLEQQQNRAYLNFADPASVAKTFDALVDQPAQVLSLTQKAQQALQAAENTVDEDARQELMAQAADYGAQAYKLENMHPIALVNENTNLARQMIAELLQPDITDLAGGIIELAGLTPAARRLKRVTGEVINQDENILNKLAKFAVTPENKAAVMAEKSTYTGATLYKPSSWWSTGASQAEMAADKLHRFVTSLLSDVDTAADAKVLLRQLAQDPAKLISGMNKNLFQSDGLLARAANDGLVRFGNMGLLSNYGAADTNLMYKILGWTGDKNAPLRIYQQMADEFLNTAESLKKGVLLNKPDFANEFVEAMQKQGYNYFNVVDEAGEKANSLIGSWGHAFRKVVSPMYIYTNPGGWATNYISGVLGAFGDGHFSFLAKKSQDSHLQKLYGVDPTVRGLEGAASAMTAAGQLPGQTGKGILGTLKKWYGGIDESVGGRVFYSAVTHALQKTGKDVLQNTMAPMLQQLGITDPRQARSIINHLFETGYSGGNMVDEFNKLVTGQARIFNLSDVNAGWLDALPADSLTEFYDILRKAPDAPTAQTQLTAWADKATAYWDNLIQQSPVIPARHSWMKQEVVQDTADIAQAGKMAQKYGGVPPEQIAEVTKRTTAAIQDTQKRMEALMNVVTESANPVNRYMLYNIWGSITDKTADVRAKLGDMAERVSMLPKEQRPAAWGQYWDEAQKLWTERNDQVNRWLEAGAQSVAKGEDFTPNLSQWDILERTAKVNEQTLWDTLRLEPQAASYDTRLKQVIDAGRQLADKAVARTYAAARRFADVDAMDYIISAERNAQMAGAQARSYLDEVLAATLQSGKWEDYYSIRNETWRQLRQYEQQVWGIAERNIVRDGLGVEKATGLKFNAGPDGVVELVAPEKVAGQVPNRMGPNKQMVDVEHQYWIVKREDGTTTSVPDNMVPKPLKDKYNGIAADDIEAEIATELDNIASAHPFADEAQKILDDTAVKVDEGAAYKLVQPVGDEPTDYAKFATTADEAPAVPVASIPTTPVVEAAKNTLQTLRDIAKKAGLPTANANGSPLDLPLWNAVKKYFAQNNIPLAAKKLNDLAGDELEKAIQFVGEKVDVAKASDMYRAQGAGAQEAARTLAAAWDADATATLGLPKMELLAKQYRDGERVFEFEDLYGRTVGGTRIENSDDVLKLVQQYVGLRADVTDAQQTVKATQKYAKQSKAEILRAERDNLLKAGYSTEELNAASRTEILRFIEITTQKPLPDPNMIFFEGSLAPGLGNLVEKVKKALNLGNSAEVADLNKMADKTIKNTTQAGGMYAPDVAYAAQHARDQIANILAYVNKNLDNIMTPKGAIAEGQALRAVNDFRRQVMPAWDNVKNVASEYGNRMRSFTMVDFANNTRIDEILSLAFPYSFWSTRAMKNSRERMLFEPQIWRRMMQAHNYLNRFAEQRGDPDRYDGMFPVDLGNGMTYYLRIDPTKYWPTFGLFMQNDYADPESANNAFSFGLESVRASGFNPYPWFDMASKAITNVQEGKPIAQDVSVVDYLPIGKPLAWMAARVMGPNFLPQGLQPGYYEYNIGRELTTMVSEGSITPDQAQYAQELLRMMRTGEQILPEMAGQQDALNAILRTATERAANKELLSSASSWGTGFQVKPFDQDERQAMQASQTYRDREYNAVTNPYGSEMAQNATFDQYPELQPRFSQSSILNEEMTRPGASAALSQRITETKDARDALYGLGDAAVDAYLKTNPMATKKEIAAARTQAIIENASQFVDPAALDAYLKTNPDAYYSEVVKFVTDTIAGKYPSADLVESSGKPKDYAPLEQKWNFQEDTLKAAAEQFPYPAYPTGGTNEQIAAYMKQKEAIDAQRQQWMMTALTTGTTGGAQLVTAGPEGWKPWDSGLGTDPATAAKLIEENKYKYATDAERARLQEIEQFGNIDPRTGFNKWGYDANGNYNPDFDTMGSKRGSGGAEWRAATANVESYFGPGGLEMWNQYYALPKDSEARKQFKKDNPVFKVVSLYAYNKAEMETAFGLFGEEAVLKWAQVPAADGTPEAKAARDAYWDENPQSFLFHSWLNGRPANYDENKAQGDDFKYNFGADYATAQEMFGANIWEIVGGYKRGWDKAQTRAYFEANPQLGDFFDWWYGGEKKTGTGTGRSYGGGGGGYRGGSYASYAPKEKDTKGFNPYYNTPYVKPDEMDNYLMPRENYINKWKPENASLAWLNAGSRLAPGQLRDWKPGSKKVSG